MVTTNESLTLAAPSIK